MNPALESLRWQKFPALSSGFVCLVDAMGDDASVVQAARVSYGKDKRELSAGIEQGPTPVNLHGSVLED